MPKERINDGHGYDIVVGWSNGSVQLATEVVAGDPGEPATLHGLVTSGAVDEDARGLYVSFGPNDRSAINNLIRTLRRARDSAFGRDE